MRELICCPKMKLNVSITVLAMLLNISNRSKGSQPSTESIEKVFNFSEYDSDVGPFALTGEAVVIEVDFDILTLGPVNELSMEYSMSMYFRQQWADPRFKHEYHTDPLLASYHHLHKFWLPDLFFPESKSERFHDVTVPNIYLRILPNGTLVYSQRLSLTMNCLMNLRKFPLDKQSCRFKIESYGYTTNEIKLIWSSQRQFSSVLPSANVPDFNLVEIKADDCTSKLQTGEFPCLSATLELKRQIGFYLTQTYIPTILIVALSWVSFWIDARAIPARISVGLLTVLTLTTQSSGARADLPRVPYIKSIDIWMSACLVFVFAAYIEFALVAVLSRRYKKYSHSVLKRAIFLPTISSSSIEEVNINTRQIEFTSQTSDTSGRDFSISVDKISRCLFPCVFCIFNVCYWLYYSEF